jgi:hypothetical protein
MKILYHIADCIAALVRLIKAESVKAALAIRQTAASVTDLAR